MLRLEFEQCRVAGGQRDHQGVVARCERAVIPNGNSGIGLHLENGCVLIITVNEISAAVFEETDDRVTTFDGCDRTVAGKRLGTRLDRGG